MNSPMITNEIVQSGPQRRWRRLLAFLLPLFLHLAESPAVGEVRDAGNPPNAPHQRGKPYVLLISLDGFRHDYAERYGATNLLALGRAGVRAEALVPVYPSLTFPALYSMVTGLRPANHGLVHNHFHDPRTGKTFVFNDGMSASQGEWFGGTPLWVLAEQQGMRSANFFWVGSEAEIQGVRPSYWAPYDGSIPHSTRVRQVLDWFQLAEDLRPHFVTLYFSDVDSAGHQFGPDSAEVRDAVRHVDASLSELLKGLRELPLKVNVIVVSDHGMEEVQGDWIELHEWVELTGLIGTGGASQVMYHSSDPRRIEEAYNQLHNADARFSVYRRQDMPAHLQYSRHERIGDLVVIPNGPYMLARDQWRPLPQIPKRRMPVATHGYDPSRHKNMNGIFFAAGPNLAAGIETGVVDSLDIYPLIARILDLNPPAELDGSFERVRHLHRKGSSQGAAQ
jgi:predicted AlkP superfamily pyrophosphatase or phosphodiesterase